VTKSVITTSVIGGNPDNVGLRAEWLNFVVIIEKARRRFTVTRPQMDLADKITSRRLTLSSHSLYRVAQRFNI